MLYYDHKINQNKKQMLRDIQKIKIRMEWKNRLGQVVLKT